MPQRTAERAPARIEPVTTLAALEALRTEWDQLWSADPAATPFQHPAWVLPWWRHIGRGTLASVALRAAGGELVAFAPLYLYDEDGGRQLFPIGIATTDYLDVLVKPGWEHAALAAIADRLAAQADDFRVLHFPQLRPGSALAQLPGPGGWRRELLPSQPHPVLDLRDPAAIPKSMHDNVRHCRSRAERTGTLAFETAQSAQLAPWLEVLARLHALRWSQRGEPGVLQDPAVLAAHREAAPQLHATGLLRLHALRLDGEIVAVLYALMDPAARAARRCYYYLGGFDPRHAAFSPGTLLLAHAIAHARAEGAVAFDFLRGREPYKYRWGAIDQPMVTLRIARVS